MASSRPGEVLAPSSYSPSFPRFPRRRLICLLPGLLLCLPGCPSSLPDLRQRSRRYEECSQADARAALAEARSQIESGRPLAALPLLRTVLRLCPEHVPSHLLYQDTAMDLPPGEDFDPAKGTLEMLGYYKQLADDPRSPLLPFLRARNARCDEQEAACQKLLRTSLERDRNFYYAHREMGLLWWGVGKPDKALEGLQKALSLKPGFLEARHELAQVHAELGHWKLAAEHYRGYLTERPKDLAAMRKYVSILLYKLDGKAPVAEPLLRQLLDSAPDDPALTMHMAALHWQLGRTQAALDLYRQVIARDPRDARAVINMGNLYYDGYPHRGEAEKRSAWGKARRAYRYYLALAKVEDGHDWFDRHLAVRYRLQEIEKLLGEAGSRPVRWQDL